MKMMVKRQKSIFVKAKKKRLEMENIKKRIRNSILQSDNSFRRLLLKHKILKEKPPNVIFFFISQGVKKKNKRKS